MFLKAQHILLVVCCLLPLLAQTQTERTTEYPEGFVIEKIVLHTDRQLYISGEIIWFKMYILEANENIFSNFSKVANLELIDQSGIVISRVKLELENGQGAGSIELPKALNSGKYTLRAYTQAMRNMEEAGFGKLSLIVLNPEQPLIKPQNHQSQATKVFEPNQAILQVSTNKYLDIAIETKRTVYPQRSMVELNVSVKDYNGQPALAWLSVSTALSAPDDNRKTDTFLKTGIKARTTGSTLPKSFIFQPETNGLQLKGRAVNSETGQGTPGIKIYLSFPGKRSLLYMTNSTHNGAFSFLLPKLYGLRQVVLQVDPKVETPVLLELSDEFHGSRTEETEAFILPPEWLPLANSTLINAQIGQSYKAFEMQPEYTYTDPFAESSFFGQPDVQYRLDDYTRFPLPEFFFEVVPEVRVRGKFGNERLKVLNDWELEEGENDPLLLVDGVPVFDQKTFLNINNKLIASTEIVTAPFWLNPDIFDGVIQISSFEGDARSFTLPESALRSGFLAFLPQRIFSTPDYDAISEQHLPDFRNTLYWNPSVRTDVEGKATITFFTSDAIGDYVINIQAAADNGMFGSAKKPIEVAKVNK